MRGNPSTKTSAKSYNNENRLNGLIGNFLPVSHNTDGTLIPRNILTGLINVMDPQFGAKGDGVADDTAAIQAAINFATGNAAPATNVRQARSPVYLPPGTYKIKSDLVIRSVLGFRFMGAAMDQVTILASGTAFTQAVILIDGSCDGVFEGFYLKGDGTEQVPDGIRLDWTTAAARSTTENAFRDIRIRALKSVVGISLEGNNYVQLDSTTFENVSLTGGQTLGSWSSSGNWQKGFAFGNGNAANNYDHRMFGCDSGFYYMGAHCNASSFALIGGQFLANYCDFYVVPAAPCSLKNVQSQASGTFLVSGNTILPNHVSVEDCLWTTLNPNVGLSAITVNGGTIDIKGFYAWAFSGGVYKTLVINLDNYSGNAVSATLVGVTLYGAKTATIVPQSGFAHVVVMNYQNYNPGTGVYAAISAGDLISTYSGSSWNNIA